MTQQQHRIGPSVMDVASGSGLLALSPSDLVFESSQHGVEYYDFVLSTVDICDDDDNTAAVGVVFDDDAAAAAITADASIIGNNGKKFSLSKCADYNTVAPSTSASVRGPPLASLSPDGDRVLPATTLTGDGTPPVKGYKLFLAKLDAQTNVEWFETARVPAELLTKTGIPATELAMITMGVLIWRNTLSRSKLLCLVNQLNDDNSVALEALKRATNKFKCVHHVLTIGARRASSTSTNSNSSSSSYRSSISSNSSQESMKLRVLMCQSRNELSDLPAQAVRETKFLLAPSSNPLLCLCFPLT